MAGRSPLVAHLVQQPLGAQRGGRGEDHLVGGEHPPPAACGRLRLFATVHLVAALGCAVATRVTVVSG